MVEHICSKCGCTEFSRDGSVELKDRATGLVYGKRQRYKCKKCSKVWIGSWTSFDKGAYDKVKKEQFRQFLEDKAEYDKAKEQLGTGGFRVSDL
jgi:hypothetical protein